MEKWHLARLITLRSTVRIRPPLPGKIAFSENGLRPVLQEAQSPGEPDRMKAILPEPSDDASAKIG